MISTAPDRCHAQQLGVDEAVLHGEQEARQPGDAAADDERGELVRIGREAGRAHALLVDADAGQRTTEAELQAFVKERLAPYKYPRFIEFLDELPKTATGKIQRFRLRERERERGRH